MSLLEDARRLAAEIHPHRSAAQDDTTEFCVFCDGCARAGYVADHATDCPWLSMARIAEALEAAERVAHADEPTCERRVVECVCCLANRDLPEFGREDHAHDCPWQALVAALKDEDE